MCLPVAVITSKVVTPGEVLNGAAVLNKASAHSLERQCKMQDGLSVQLGAAQERLCAPSVCSVSTPSHAAHLGGSYAQHGEVPGLVCAHQIAVIAAVETVLACRCMYALIGWCSPCTPSAQLGQALGLMSASAGPCLGVPSKAMRATF